MKAGHRFGSVLCDSFNQCFDTADWVIGRTSRQLIPKDCLPEKGQKKIEIANQSNQIKCDFNIRVVKPQPGIK